MPHRTVFQWGKNTAHPFTVFMGGLVIGALVTGVIAYAWMMANDTGVEFQEVVVPGVQTTASPSPKLSPTASPNSGQPQF
ncbi:hypothetical protein EXS54_00710 [Patescibacteria group bacterium]|nr:hypothetical protein [Patescibacteria group bacterium]